MRGLTDIEREIVLRVRNVPHDCGNMRGKRSTRDTCGSANGQAQDALVKRGILYICCHYVEGDKRVEFYRLTPSGTMVLMLDSIVRGVLVPSGVGP
jgi:hypothetical protein